MKAPKKKSTPPRKAPARAADSVPRLIRDAQDQKRSKWERAGGTN